MTSRTLQARSRLHVRRTRGSAASGAPFASGDARPWHPLRSQLVPQLEPPLQRGLRLPRRSTGKQALDAYVFVEVRPMNALATPNEAPLRPLGDRSMCEPRIPSQRDGETAAVRQIDDERVARDLDSLCQSRSNVDCRRTHATPPREETRCRLPVQALEAIVPPARQPCKTDWIIVIDETVTSCGEQATK